jgi:hypothetical protein
LREYLPESLSGQLSSILANEQNTDIRFFREEGSRFFQIQSDRLHFWRIQWDEPVLLAFPTIHSHDGVLKIDIDNS